MRDRHQSALAAVAGALLIVGASLGGVAPGSSPVGTAEADPLAGCPVAQIGPVVFSDVTGVLCDQPDTDKLEELDAQETKTEIYDQASIQKQNNELVDTSFTNYLDDTQQIALMEGKNAYIRALNDGANESVARQKATDAVADYYAIKQRNLVAQWNTSAITIKSMAQTAQNTSDVSSSYVHPTTSSGGYDGVIHHNHSANSFDYSVTTTVTLVNGSEAYPMQYEFHYGGSQDYTSGMLDGDHSTLSGDATFTGVFVNPPDGNHSEMQVVDASKYPARWTEIEQQNDQAQSSIDEFVNATYSEYQQGEINSSDLVDPYLGSRSYDPKNQSTWTLRSLTSMGIDPPENLSNIGRMNISAYNETYTGILMSDGTPESGYTVGDTYNATNITGHQFIALDDGGSVELNGTFTLDSVETADGEVVQEGDSVTYKNVTYETANTSEYKALQEELDEMEAQLNAQQQEERNAGGGGLLPDFDLGGAAVPAVVLVGAGAAVLVLGRS